MALSGVHVACGYVGGYAAISQQIPLLSAIAWSQTMTAAGTTSQAAPSQMAGSDPSFEIRASADVYVAVGAVPDASQATGSGNAARIFVPAGVTRNIFCKPGDKLAWIAA